MVPCCMPHSLHIGLRRNTPNTAAPLCPSLPLGAHPLFDAKTVPPVLYFLVGVEQVSISKLRQRLNVPPPPTPSAAVSLPPPPGEALAPSPLPAPKPRYKLEKNSLIRRKAVAIVAMRAQGFSTDEIAAELQIKPQSVHAYVYRATKSGFLVNKQGQSLLTDPKDHIEFELAHKAVRNLGEFLDSDDDTTRERVTLEVAKGALWKKFDVAKDAAMPGMQVLAVRIEMPAAGKDVPQADLSAMGGTPSYVEGSVEGADDGSDQ